MQFNIRLNIWFNIWLNIRFNIGLNIKFNIGFNILFNIGFNNLSNIRFNIQFNIWFNIWFNIKCNLSLSVAQLSSFVLFSLCSKYFYLVNDLINDVTFPLWTYQRPNWGKNIHTQIHRDLDIMMPVARREMAVKSAKTVINPISYCVNIGRGDSGPKSRCTVP